MPIPPVSRRFWASCPVGMQTGLKPSSSGDYMDVWPSWSLLHPPRICFRQSEKPNRWKWRDLLPTWVAPINSHEEELAGGAGAEAHADGLQPSKWTNSPWPMPDSRILLVRSLTRPMEMAGVVEDACRQINAVSVVDSATGHSNARREVERAGDEEAVADEEDEEAVVEDKAKDKVSLLLWLSRGQRRQGARCNSLLTLPQCPVAETRETSLALSWPARTAAGAVGRSGAS